MSQIEDFFVREMVNGELGPRRPLAEGDILNLNPLEIRGGLALYKIEKTVTEVDTDEECDEVVEVVRPECRACRFYEPDLNAPVPYNGYCNRFPPVVAGFVEFEGAEKKKEELWGFPGVEGEDWCGEFQVESPLWKPPVLER